MGTAARRLLRASMEAATNAAKLQESYDAGLVNEIFRHSVKKQTGVSLKYMLDFGQKPIDKQIILSAQFLHLELPIRLAHRVAELENLPFGLSSMKPVLKVCICTHKHGHVMLEHLSNRVRVHFPHPTGPQAYLHA
jgi:pyruvate dehydrogenase kinase 2/3/4